MGEKTQSELFRFVVLTGLHAAYVGKTQKKHLKLIGY
jgi:hypothetical protein